MESRCSYNMVDLHLLIVEIKQRSYRWLGLHLMNDNNANEWSKEGLKYGLILFQGQNMVIVAWQA